MRCASPGEQRVIFAPCRCLCGGNELTRRFKHHCYSIHCLRLLFRDVLAVRSAAFVDQHLLLAPGRFFRWRPFGIQNRLCIGGHFSLDASAGCRWHYGIPAKHPTSQDGSHMAKSERSTIMWAHEYMVAKSIDCTSTSTGSPGPKEKSVTFWCRRRRKASCVAGGGNVVPSWCAGIPVIWSSRRHEHGCPSRSLATDTSVSSQMVSASREAR